MRLISTALAGLIGAICPSVVQAQDALAEATANPTVRFFSVVDRSWAFRADYSIPRDSFNRAFRDIDLLTSEAERAWTFHGPLEVSANVGVDYAAGARSDPFSAAPERRVNLVGINGGGGIRIYAARTSKFALFADGRANFLWTLGKQFPPGGTGFNAYLRYGVGGRVSTGKRTAIEAGVHYTHVSNGAGIVEQNPAYNGKGVFLTLRLFDR